MFLRILFINLVIVVWLGNATDESPGFFLKVAKNVPRLGRRSNNEYDSFFLKASKSVPRIGRSDSNFVDADVPNSERNPTWYDRMMTPAKRRLSGQPVELGGPKPYRTVQPFDSNFLFDIVANDNVNRDNFKFVSWQDFDVALESDTELFEKLVSLAKGEHELHGLADKVSVEQFVPMGGINGADGQRYREGNSIFYRMNRGGGIPTADKSKESVEYQM